MAFIRDENAGALPLTEWSSAMPQQLSDFKQSVEKRLAEEAKHLREQAELLPPGAVREATLRKARQTETASHMSEWLSSPGLQPPK